MTDKLDLTAVESMDLAEELSRRHDVFFCFGVRDKIDILGADDGHDHVLRFIHGDSARLIGSMMREIFAVLHEDYDDSHPTDPEED